MSSDITRLGIRGLNINASFVLNEAIRLGKGREVARITCDNGKEKEALLAFYLNEQVNPFTLALLVQRDREVRGLLEEELLEFVRASMSIPEHLLREFEGILKREEEERKVEVPLSIVIGIADALRLIEHAPEDKRGELLRRLKQAVRPTITDMSYHFNGEEIRQIVEYYLEELRKEEERKKSEVATANATANASASAFNAVNVNANVNTSTANANANANTTTATVDTVNIGDSIAGSTPAGTDAVTPTEPAYGFTEPRPIISGSTRPIATARVSHCTITLEIFHGSNEEIVAIIRNSLEQALKNHAIVREVRLQSLQ